MTLLSPHKEQEYITTGIHFKENSLSFEGYKM